MAVRMHGKSKHSYVEIPGQVCVHLLAKLSMYWISRSLTSFLFAEVPVSGILTCYQVHGNKQQISDSSYGSFTMLPSPHRDDLCPPPQLPPDIDSLQKFGGVSACRRHQICAIAGDKTILLA